jgi:hypothetical protein
MKFLDLQKLDLEKDGQRDVVIQIDSDGEFSGMSNPLHTVVKFKDYGIEEGTDQNPLEEDDEGNSYLIDWMGCGHEGEERNIVAVTLRDGILIPDFIPPEINRVIVIYYNEKHEPLSDENKNIVRFVVFKSGIDSTLTHVNENGDFS